MSHDIHEVRAATPLQNILGQGRLPKECNRRTAWTAPTARTLDCGITRPRKGVKLFTAELSTEIVSIFFRKSEGQEGSCPEGWCPEGWGPQFRVVLLCSAPYFALFSSLWGSSRGVAAAAQGPKCALGFLLGSFCASPGGLKAAWEERGRCSRGRVQRRAVAPKAGWLRRRGDPTPDKVLAKKGGAQTAGPPDHRTAGLPDEEPTESSTDPLGTRDGSHMVSSYL